MTDTCTGSSLVFIVGSPRSGTTYLQRLLASHEMILTGQESNVFQYAGPLLRRWHAEGRQADGRGGVGLGCYFEEQEFLQLLKGFLRELLQPMIGKLNPGMLFVEKTPQHAVFLPEIIELLPACRIIHMVRDPRDVVASMLAVSRSWGRGWAPRSARRSALIWLRQVRAAKEAQNTIPAEQFYEVRYEDLVAQPTSILQNLVSFLKLSWAEDAITEAVRRNSIAAVRKGGGTPIPKGGRFAEHNGDIVRDPADFIRSGVPGSWRRDLGLSEKLCVWLVTRRMMRVFGYQ
ncbi:MAG: sulfotransferase [Phycisphaerales bacterium]|nr:MAG: sulfotransferase [Phycisphaerales bacterium]